MARVDAASELDALKAQLADFALRNAAEAIAKDPKKFLSSDVMKAVEQAALVAVEARLAKEPRPSPEDFAEQVLILIRPELAAAVHGAAGQSPRAAGGRGRDAPPESASLMQALQRHWAAAAVVALLVAAAGGGIGYLAGQGLARSDAERAARQLRPDTESTDGLAVTSTPPAKSDAPPTAAPAGDGRPAGTARPQR